MSEKSQEDCICKCHDCQECLDCNAVEICPFNLVELAAMEKEVARRRPISGEKHMKLIQFAKGFALDPSKERKIILDRADEETIKRLSDDDSSSKEESKKSLSED